MQTTKATMLREMLGCAYDNLMAAIEVRLHKLRLSTKVATELLFYLLAQVILDRRDAAVRAKHELARVVANNCPCAF
jgi:hypothetical protein